MTTPTAWIGTSWKMNKVMAEAESFAKALAAADGDRDERIQRFVIPPFTAVRQVKEILADTSVKVGAQNMHWDNAGAWTGEVSPAMLTDCNGPGRTAIVELLRARIWLPFLRDLALVARPRLTTARHCCDFRASSCGR